MYIDLYNHPKFSDYDVSSLNAGIMSGSACPVDVVNDVIEKLNAKNIVVSQHQFFFVSVLSKKFKDILLGSVWANGDKSSNNLQQLI